jgi:hypothetical protein
MKGVLGFQPNGEALLTSLISARDRDFNHIDNLNANLG